MVDFYNIFVIPPYDKILHKNRLLRVFMSKKGIFEDVIECNFPLNFQKDYFYYKISRLSDYCRIISSCFIKYSTC